MRDPLLRALIAAGCLVMLAVALLPILDSDDAYYATVARTMLSSGDWITLQDPIGRVVPRPPLTIWLMALSMRVGGESALALRLWQALLGVGLVLAVYRLARLGADKDEALLAALLWVTTLQVFYQSLLPQQDVPLTLFLTLAFIAYLTYRAGRTVGAPLAGVWLALATLSKGIVAPLVFVAVAAADALIARRRSCFGQWRWSHIAGGALTFLVIAVPWFAAGAIKQGSPFVDTFFVGGDAAFGRYFQVKFGPSIAYWKALLAFVPILAAGMLPWTGWLPGAVREGWRALRTGPPAAQLCAVWAGLYFLAASLSSGDKEIRYLFPLLPPLMVLVARGLARGIEDRGDLRRVGLVTLGMGVVVAVVIVWLRAHAGDGPGISTSQLFLPVGILFLLGLVASGLQALRGRGRQAVAVAAVAALFSYGIAEWTVARRWEWLWPWRPVAAAFRQHYRPGDRLLLAGDIAGETSFVYYYLSPPADRSIVHSYSMNDWAFLDEWRREGGAFGLMAPESYARLRDRLDHEVLVHMPSGWVLVAKR